MEINLKNEVSRLTKVFRKRAHNYTYQKLENMYTTKYANKWVLNILEKLMKNNFLFKLVSLDDYMI